jgi:hypothetical protein
MSVHISGKRIWVVTATTDACRNDHEEIESYKISTAIKITLSRWCRDVHNHWTILHLCCFAMCPQYLKDSPFLPSAEGPGTASTDWMDINFFRRRHGRDTCNYL